MSFLSKIKLTNKKVYFLGGFGLIGSRVVNNMTSIDAKIVILDIQKKKIQKNVKYEKFDCSKLKTLDKEKVKLLKLAETACYAQFGVESLPLEQPSQLQSGCTQITAV